MCEGPECPQCGSVSALRLSGALLPSDDYDAASSGIYGCRHCGNEYQYLQAAKPKAEEPKGRPMRGGAFSPNAKCPKCGKHETTITSTRSVKRYHLCLSKGCGAAFFTVRADKVGQ